MQRSSLHFFMTEDCGCVGVYCQCPHLYSRGCCPGRPPAPRTWPWAAAPPPPATQPRRRRRRRGPAPPWSPACHQRRPGHQPPAAPAVTNTPAFSNMLPSPWHHGTRSSRTRGWTCPPPGEPGPLATRPFHTWTRDMSSHVTCDM